MQMTISLGVCLCNQWRSFIHLQKCWKQRLDRSKKVKNGGELGHAFRWKVLWCSIPLAGAFLAAAPTWAWPGPMFVSPSRSPRLILQKQFSMLGGCFCLAFDYFTRLFRKEKVMEGSWRLQPAWASLIQRTEKTRGLGQRFWNVLKQKRGFASGFGGFDSRMDKR